MKQLSDLISLPKMNWGECAGAVGADAGVADALAALAFGPGLPHSTLAGYAGVPVLASVTDFARTLVLEDSGTTVYPLLRWADRGPPDKGGVSGFGSRRALPNQLRQRRMPL
jgi:hypothetical protein